MCIELIIHILYERINVFVRVGRLNANEGAIFFFFFLRNVSHFSKLSRRRGFRYNAWWMKSERDARLEFYPLVLLFLYRITLCTGGIRNK